MFRRPDIYSIMSTPLPRPAMPRAAHCFSRRRRSELRVQRSTFDVPYSTPDNSEPSQLSVKPGQALSNLVKAGQTLWGYRTLDLRLWALDFGRAPIGAQ